MQFMTPPQDGNMDRVRARGGRILTTAGSAEKCAYARAQGADHALNYRDGDWEIVVQEQPPQRIDRAACEDDPEWLETYDDAARDGECHLFHLWPPDPGEDDTVH